ncbi:hypothetical protein ACI792_12990 [Blastococcus sp. SYSU DS0669]
MVAGAGFASRRGRHRRRPRRLQARGQLVLRGIRIAGRPDAYLAQPQRFGQRRNQASWALPADEISRLASPRSKRAKERLDDLLSDLLAAATQDGFAWGVLTGLKDAGLTLERGCDRFELPYTSMQRVVHGESWMTADDHAELMQLGPNDQTTNVTFKRVTAVRNRFLETRRRARSRRRDDGHHFEPGRLRVAGGRGWRFSDQVTVPRDDVLGRPHVVRAGGAVDHRLPPLHPRIERDLHGYAQRHPRQLYESLLLRPSENSAARQVAGDRARRDLLRLYREAREGLPASEEPVVSLRIWLGVPSSWTTVRADEDGDLTWEAEPSRLVGVAVDGVFGPEGLEANVQLETAWLATVFAEGLADVDGRLVLGVTRREAPSRPTHVAVLGIGRGITDDLVPQAVEVELRWDEHGVPHLAPR